MTVGGRHPAPRRGDVFYANLSPVVGSEQGGTRPVLVVQNDIGNLHSRTVIVAPMTGAPKDGHMPTQVPVGDGEVAGLVRGSVVLTEQLRTIDKRRLREWAGALGAEAMREVDRALVTSLGLDA